MPDATPDVPIPAPRPRRKRRLLKLTIALLIAVVLIAAVIQWFIWSDHPRQIAERVAGNATGLRVEIGHLDIHWNGKIRIDDLRVSLPLADKPFLTAPQVNVTVPPLPLVILSAGATLQRLDVANAQVDVRQSADGAWNLQQVLAQIAAAGKQASDGATALPDLTLTNAQVTVTRADGKTVSIQPIEIIGRHSNLLTLNVKATVSDLIDADANISATGRWPHEAQVIVKPPLLRAIEPFTGHLPTFACAQFDWQGERTATGLTGRLTIPEKSTQAGPVIASGATTITVDGGIVTASPDNLSVTAPGLPSLTLAGGNVALNGAQLTFTGVRAKFADGFARLAGSADLAKQRGQLDASWEQIAFPPGIVHGGHLSLEAANIWPGRPWVKADVGVLATVGGGTFETAATLAGDGPSWADTTFVVDLPVARYSRKSELRLQDVKAVVHTTADTVELTSVQVRQSTAGQATLNAHGLYHFAATKDGQSAGTGYFTAVGDHFVFGGDHDLGFNVNAWADPQSITLQNAYAHLGTEAFANLAGQYTFGRPEPVSAELSFDTDPALSLQLSNSMAIAGHASGSMHVGGTLSPAHITLEGRLSSRKLKVDKYVIGDADLAISGDLLSDRADVKTQHLRAFGGEGWFGCEFPYFSDELHGWMGFENIDLAHLGQAVGTDRLAGSAAGQIELHVPVADLPHMYGDGHIDIADVVARPALAAKAVHIPVKIGEGYVKLTPSASQIAGGTASGFAQMSLDEPTNLHVETHLTNWLTQLPLEEFSTVTNGELNLPQLDLARAAVSGKIDVRSQFFAHDNPIGNVAIRLKADGRQVKLETVEGDVLDGKISGQGSVDFDDLSAGRLQASVTNLSLAKLEQIDPRAAGMAGQISATIDSHAADGENPLGPLQADLDIRADAAMYKSVQIGDSQVRVYADRNRVALADDPKRPNLVGIAGGIAKIWGRLSQVPGRGEQAKQLSAYLSVHMDGIDTEQLDQMIDPDGKPTPGRVAGDIVAFGNPADFTRMNGQGQLRLTQSDLANVGPIAVLYDAMHLSLGASQPNGYGQVNFVLNDGTLNVTNLDYFNRGIFARGSITLDNVLKLKNSPVHGYMLGTVRPLKDVKLPFLGTLDSILDALQSGATTIYIEGTMEKDKLKTTPASLRAMSKGFKSILVGEAQAK